MTARLNDLRERKDDLLPFIMSHASPRNAELTRMVLEGETLLSASERFGITPSRVRQIINHTCALEHRAKLREAMAARVKADKERRHLEQIERFGGTNVHIDQLRIPYGVWKALTALGLVEVEKIVCMTDDELLQLPRIGRKSLNEIRRALAEIASELPRAHKLPSHTA